MPDALTSFSVEVENFALVTYRVPASRVAPLVPDPYEHEVFEDASEPYCFVSTSCFCNRRFRVTGLPWPHLTFNESTYRIYVSYRGRRSVYFLGRYLGRIPATGPQRVVARDTWPADFDVWTDHGDDGYRRYDFRADGPKGETSFAISAARPPAALGPFDSALEHTQYLTYRLSGLFTATGGFQGHMPVSHPPMKCFEGDLGSARLDLWDDTGVLTREEAQRPFSVLVAPLVPFVLHSPRPVRA